MTILASIRRSVDLLSYNIIISASTRNYFGCRKVIRFLLLQVKLLFYRIVITLITIHTFIALVGSAIEL